MTAALDLVSPEWAAALPADGTPILDCRPPNTPVWGVELILYLGRCDPATVTRREPLVTFVADLVKLLDMSPFGDTFAEHFGHAKPETSGFSVAQMIEESLISGHFCDTPPSARFNIFSCRPYGVTTAVLFAAAYFDAHDVVPVVLIR